MAGNRGPTLSLPINQKDRCLGIVEEVVEVERRRVYEMRDTGAMPECEYSRQQVNSFLYECFIKTLIAEINEKTEQPVVS